ncbi:MAG: hypothetical protein MJ146_02665 [Clostridia bacterium]|nr:hypothetical protein [Clostridia bacterium]
MKKILVGALVLIMCIAMTACGAKELPDLTGHYEDQISQRAMMDIEKTEGDTYSILIHWSSSASEGLEWEASGTFDGDKIQYTDCKCQQYTYDDTGDLVKSEVMGENKTGTLTVGEGLDITWEGDEAGETAEFIQVAL